MKTEITYTCNAASRGTDDGMSFLHRYMEDSPKACELLEDLLGRMRLKRATWVAYRFHGSKSAPVRSIHPSWEASRYLFVVRTGPFVGFLMDCIDADGTLLRGQQVWSRWLEVKDKIKDPNITADTTPEPPSTQDPMIDAVTITQVIRAAYAMRGSDDAITAADLRRVIDVQTERRPIGRTAAQITNELTSQGYLVALDERAYGFEDQALELVNGLPSANEAKPALPALVPASPIPQPLSLSFFQDLQAKAGQIKNLRKDLEKISDGYRRNRQAVEDISKQIESLTAKRAAHLEELGKLDERKAEVETTLLGMADAEAALGFFKSMKDNL